MTISHGKLQVMNNALRMVGSYHLDADDTTSVSYEIVNRAFDDAIVTIFSENVFKYNTIRKYYGGTGIEAPVDVSTLSNEEKPADKWKYRITLPNKGPFNSEGFQKIVKVTNKEGTTLLDWHVEIYQGNLAVYYDEPYRLFTTEKEFHVYYTFVPDAQDEGQNRGDAVANMDAHLIKPITLHIAQSICIELSGSETRQQALLAQYERAIRRARVIEGRGNEPQRYIHDGNSQIMSAHYGYGSV